MSYLELPRQVGTMELWSQTNWAQPGLPPRFRISLRGDFAEYRSRPINPQEQPIRARMMGLLGAGPLVTGLNELLRDTRVPPNFEFSSYIRSNGELEEIISARDRGAAPVPPVPPGPIDGYVHSHPTPEALFAPPSDGDYGPVSFTAQPIQLVAEMCGRIWGLFAGRFSTWLGTINAGAFQPQAHAPTNQRVYLVIPGDTIRAARALRP